jgi:hypothetical protein
MQTISASSFFFKRIFPTVWFGVLAISLLVALVSGAVVKWPMWLVMPFIMGIFGYFLMRRLVFDLADEVLDAGDYLLVRNSGREIQIRISDIINVSTSLMQNPPRVTLRLAAPSEFGSEIAFMVKRDSIWNPFVTTCAVADDLVKRVDAARRNPALGSPGAASSGPAVG